MFYPYEMPDEHQSIPELKHHTKGGIAYEGLIILQLDLLATDFYRDAALPSYLYYNPNQETRTVTVSVGDKPLKIYDALQRTFLEEHVAGQFTFNISMDNSALLVLVPQNAIVS